MPQNKQVQNGVVETEEIKRIKDQSGKTIPTKQKEIEKSFNIVHESSKLKIYISLIEFLRIHKYIDPILKFLQSPTTPI